LVDRIEAMPGQFGYGAINIALASKKQPSSSTYRPPPSSATARRSTEQSPHRREENKRIKSMTYLESHKMGKTIERARRTNAEAGVTRPTAAADPGLTTIRLETHNMDKVRDHSDMT
jgi:hypothetical protein